MALVLSPWGWQGRHGPGRRYRPRGSHGNLVHLGLKPHSNRGNQVLLPLPRRAPSGPWRGGWRRVRVPWGIQAAVPWWMQAVGAVAGVGRAAGGQEASVAARAAASAHGCRHKAPPASDCPFCPRSTKQSAPSARPAARPGAWPAGTPAGLRGRDGVCGEMGHPCFGVVLGDRDGDPPNYGGRGGEVGGSRVLLRSDTDTVAHFVATSQQIQGGGRLPSCQPLKQPSKCPRMNWGTHPSSVRTLLCSHILQPAFWGHCQRGMWAGARPQRPPAPWACPGHGSGRPVGMEALPGAWCR